MHVTFPREGVYRRLREDRVYRVMVFDPRGCHPRGVLATSTTLYSADDDLVFAVTLGESWSALDDELPFSEFDWFSPQELRHIGALLLCERDHEEGIIQFYPIVRFTAIVEFDAAVNDLAEIEPSLRKALLDRARSRDDEHRPNHQDIYLRACYRRGPYNIAPNTHLNRARFVEYWNGIDVRDYVMMRGIYALIKSDMLTISDFTEEAIVIVYIAMEATFQLILKELARKGVSQPKGGDAARWVYENFDKPFGIARADSRFFSEFYDNRVMTLHPESRFGAMPYAPGFHGDHMHLRIAMRRIIGFLISGKHDPDFVAVTKEYRDRLVHHVPAEQRQRLRTAARLNIHRKGLALGER